MATEHVIDLEHQRYADVAYAEILPDSTAAEEQARAERAEASLGRLRRRVRGGAEETRLLTRADLKDLLIVLGLDE